MYRFLSVYFQLASTRRFARLKVGSIVRATSKSKNEELFIDETPSGNNDFAPDFADSSNLQNARDFATERKSAIDSRVLLKLIFMAVTQSDGKYARSTRQLFRVRVDHRRSSKLFVALFTGVRCALGKVRVRVSRNVVHLL